MYHPVRPLLAILTWICRWQLGGTVGIILVYDVTKAASFRACQKWFATWRQENPDVIMLGNISAPVIQSGGVLLDVFLFDRSGALVANKSDLLEYAEVSVKDGERCARAMGLSFFSCSAVGFKDIAMYSYEKISQTY